MYKLSIVIPVYNSQKYIKKTLECIVNQEDFENMETILVNDGSTDSSLDIIKEFSNKYNNIVCISQENKGVSEARNTGISFAKGEYITFLDSDDYYIENINITFKLLKSKQLLVYNMKRNNGPNGNLLDFSKVDNIIHVTQDFINEFIFGSLTLVLAYSVVNKIYETDIIKKHNIRFNNKTKYAEDMLFNLEYMKYISSVYFLDKPIYMYAYNSTSAMNNISKDALDNYIESYKSLLEYCKYYGLDEKKARDWLFDKLIYVVFNIRSSDLPIRKKKSIIKEISKNKFIKENVRSINLNGLSYKRKILYLLYKLNLLTTIVWR